MAFAQWRPRSAPQRRPTPAEMGLEVTIAIVALTAPYEHFICVTDRMISHDDTLPGDENAIVKNMGISSNWSAAFSADNIENALPLLDKVRHKIRDHRETIDVDELKGHFATAISETIEDRFLNTKLRRWGYENIRQFRDEGYGHLHDHFLDLARELNESDIGVSFIVYGYDTRRATQLFEVNGQGGVTDRMAFRYAVIGSGYSIASASLKLKPLAIDFDSMLYRLLTAKFAAETASGVGKPTTVTFKRRDQHDQVMWPEEIEKFRAIWNGEMRQHEPVEALKLAGQIRIAMMKSDELNDKVKAEHLRQQSAAS